MIVILVFCVLIWIALEVKLHKSNLICRNCKVVWSSIQTDGKYLIRLSDKSEYTGNDEHWVCVATKTKVAFFDPKIIILHRHWKQLNGVGYDCQRNPK